MVKTPLLYNGNSDFTCKKIVDLTEKTGLKYFFMITRELINPQSIVVVGGSADVQKPGGKVLKNLIDHNFKGKLYVVNPKADEVQGVRAYPDAPPAC